MISIYIHLFSESHMAITVEILITKFDNFYSNNLIKFLNVFVNNS